MRQKETRHTQDVSNQQSSHSDEYIATAAMYHPTVLLLQRLLFIILHPSLLLMQVFGHLVFFHSIFTLSNCKF